MAVVATDNPIEHIYSFHRSWHFWIQMFRGLSGCLEKSLRISPPWWASGGWALTSAQDWMYGCEESPVWAPFEDVAVRSLWGISWAAEEHRALR